MRSVIQDDKWAKAIVEEACHIQIQGNYSGLVFVDGARPIGAGVFTNYWPNWSVEYTATLTDGIVGMKIARVVADYVFRTMNCHRCTAITRYDNMKAQVALRKIGFISEGIMREHFPGKIDGVVYGLLRSEQRLIRGLE